jgi:hypothetical protein
MADESTMDTLVPDLDDVPLGALRERDGGRLAPYQLSVLSQVERPRANLGSGPPARRD